MGRPLYWCVERALAKVRLRATPGESWRYTQVFALGEIAPLPKEFLPPGGARCGSARQTGARRLAAARVR